MTDERNNQECAEFQAHLPELIGSGEDLTSHPHLLSCEICRELLTELETIAKAARALFPAAEPSDKIWQQIESSLKSNGD